MAAYIKFDGVDGEAKEERHRGWSVIDSFSQGMRQPGSPSTGQTRRRGEVVLDDIVVNKKLDTASPKVAEGMLKGKVYPKVEIHLTSSYADARRVTYYAYELKNVLVTNYNLIGGSGSQKVPAEEFALNFEEIKVTYTKINRKGKKQGDIEYSWKVEEGGA